jgi:DNA repair exonuclease SbcCD ATPase subunit
MHEEADRGESSYLASKKIAPPDEPQVLRARLEHAERLYRETSTALASAKERLRQLGRVEEQRAAAHGKLGGLRARLETARAAALVFGKQGAQRLVAEGALAQIERRANTILGDAQAGASISVRWSREGQGLASACEACGAPFPSSARAKVCARCKAARGPKIISRLDLEMSDRSGALEDLGGFAMQLAASAWLRAERGSAWSVALIDEPTGQMDRRRRRAFTAHLARAFAASSFSQALVVSHDPATLESLPGKILVSRKGREASLEAVA